LDSDRVGGDAGRRSVADDLGADLMAMAWNTRFKQASAARARKRGNTNEQREGDDRDRRQAELAELERLRVEAEERQQYLDDFRRRVEEQAYFEAFDPDFEINRLDDPAYQRIEQEMTADPALKAVYEEAYQRGKENGLDEIAKRKAGAEAARLQRQQQYHSSSQDRRLDDDW
jgi:hypothetical protein